MFFPNGNINLSIDLKQYVEDTKDETDGDKITYKEVEKLDTPLIIDQSKISKDVKEFKAGADYYAYKELFYSDVNAGIGAFYKIQIPNKNLKWETSGSLDIALEGRLFNRFNFSLDFFNKSSPEHTLRKACRAFTEVTGMEFQAMGELEYYVISEDSGMFPATDQRGYHESAPYAKFNDFRTECMSYIAQAGGQIKYGHSEVGNFTLDDKIYEQNEIEFLPVRAEEAADQLVIAKWVIRNLASQYGYNITFAPKITAGKAGSGLHIHMRIMKDGQNQMLKDGALSETARKAIAGMMKLASSITAFGNTNPTSYFRLVPHQEAPTNICWGDRNRSVLVRVPLGWSAKTDMCMLANPLETPSHYDTTQKQTVEMRSPDGSADLYQLIAGLAVACRYGFEIDDALGIAEKTYVNVNIHKKENEDKLKQLAQLPDSCVASADCLEKQRAAFEKYPDDTYVDSQFLRYERGYTPGRISTCVCVHCAAVRNIIGRDLYMVQKDQMVLKIRVGSSG